MGQVSVGRREAYVRKRENCVISRGVKRVKLTTLVSNEQHMDNTRIQATPAQTAHISRQIRSLEPGQTLSGEIVSRNGNEVQIKLSDDMVLNAKVDKNINIEIGQNMTFEVKSNGSTLTLSPLYTNVATDSNVLKALEMASLAVNDTSVEMTKQLMTAGLPVNRNMLQQVFREINAFPQAEISDVVNLHKLQMPVNEANVGQMASYRNLTHQLSDGLNTVLQALPETLDSMAAKGDAAGAVKLYGELFLLVQEGENLLTSGNTGTENIIQSVTSVDTLADMSNNAIISSEQASFGENSVVLQEIFQEIGTTPENLGTDHPGQGTAVEVSGGQTTSSVISESLRTTIFSEVMNLVENLQISGQDMTSVREQLHQYSQGQGNVGDLISVLHELTKAVNVNNDALANANINTAINTNLNVQTNKNTNVADLLHKLFSEKGMRELLHDGLKKLWTITPDEVAEPGKVEELYQRLDKQLKSVANALETANQADSTAFRAVTNMNQNLDFLNQVNQMYAYVQLPLKLQNGQANGELYVYTNKKHLAQKDGPISALLHLDMEHLGPVDVYVTMQSEKVNTKFYVWDDEMLDFLEAHMDLLTRRLQKKGYDCSFSMTARQGEEAAEGGIETILRQEKGIVLSQYAFDVRT